MACRHLPIEIMSRCNLHCRSCRCGRSPACRVPVDREDARSHGMTASRASPRSVHSQGWGNPCSGGSGRAGSAGLQVSLSANGIILGERLARGRVRAGVDAMVLSLAGTTAAARAFVGR